MGASSINNNCLPEEPDLEDADDRYHPLLRFRSLAGTDCYVVTFRCFNTGFNLKIAGVPIWTTLAFIWEGKAK